MTCPNCGEPLVGDGYTSVRHCVNAIVPEDLEPDAPPVFCPASQSASVSAEKRLHTPGAGHPEYLGDSVYADWDGRLILYLDNGLGRDSMIVLEPEVIESMYKYIERNRA